jgi:hypothetical protein
LLVAGSLALPVYVVAHSLGPALEHTEASAKSAGAFLLMTIAKQIVCAAAAWKSTLGMGSTFQMELPIRAAIRMSAP